jgi:hypothetical protein
LQVVGGVIGVGLVGAVLLEVGQGMRSRRHGSMAAALVLLLVVLGGPAAAQTIELPDPADEGLTLVRGALRSDGEPVEGVVITNDTAGGDEVGVATTGDDGRWRLELGAGGDYVATIDTSTLPEGIEVRDQDLETIEFTLADGQADTLLFPLGEAEDSVETTTASGTNTSVLQDESEPDDGLGLWALAVVLIGAVILLGYGLARTFDVTADGLARAVRSWLGRDP